MFVVAGDIFVMAPLDFEVSPQHYLTVKAVAGGKQSLSDTATVTVHLLDVNDNSPEFSQNIYSAAVSEDAGPDSTVLTVKVLHVFALKPLFIFQMVHGVVSYVLASYVYTIFTIMQMFFIRQI